MLKRASGSDNTRKILSSVFSVIAQARRDHFLSEINGDIVSEILASVYTLPASSELAQYV